MPEHSEFPPFVNISQSRPEEVLAEKMAATPLIEQRWGHQVSTIGQDELGVTLTCHTVDGEVAVWAPYVVMAAGPHAGDCVDSSGSRSQGGELMLTGFSSATSGRSSPGGSGNAASTSTPHGIPAGRC